MHSHRAILALAIVSTGCPSPRDQVAPGPPLAASLHAVEARMHVRFEAARRIEDAVARSDLDRARVEAGVLTALVEPDALPRWQPYLARIRAAGQNVERAGDVVAAARASAVLGGECGRCHEEIGARLAFPVQPRPDDDARLAPQMLGHQWAAARMWEGLIGPVGDRWLDGARALSEAPLTIVAEAPKASDLGDAVGGTGRSLADDVSRVRGYARRAATASDQDARAEIFGQLLAACAHCHLMIRDR